jgi:O-methyltransferase
VDNLFLTRHFDWSFRPGWRIRTFNSLLRRVGYTAQLLSDTASGTMSSVEQRINMYHLLSQLLVFGVPGDIVEFGSLEGQSAALLRMTANQYDAARPLHVFDAFVDPPAEHLLANFSELGLQPPVIHIGLLVDTIDELPEQICFAYVDLGPVPELTRGPGASRAGLREAIGLALEKVYPRVPPNGIILLQDYHLPQQTEAQDPNPEVREVVDAFFADKPESVVALHGGPFAHAFVRKLAG